MTVDVKGRKLSEGDEVAYVEPRHKNMLLGSVVKVTPKGATILGIVEKKPVKSSRRSTQICLITAYEDLQDTGIVPALGWEDYGL